MLTFDPILAKKVETSGIVAVLIIDRVDDAIPLAHALLEGGICAMELTLRTPAALDGLKAIRTAVPEMIAGVGTILTTDQVKQVRDADAAFGVSPGLHPKVVETAQQVGLSFAPGIVTPSDIERAIELDCKLLKFFPAEPSGGLTYLKSIAAPYAHLGLRYLPLGGINSQNMISYFSDPSVPAVGGSWMAPKDLIKAGDWKQITALSLEITQAIQTLRHS